MHVRVRVHDIRIYSDYIGRRYTPVDGTLSICCVNIFDIKILHEIPAQNVSQSHSRKAGPVKNNNFSPGPTLILLIGPLIIIARLLLSRAGGMLKGLYN